MYSIMFTIWYHCFELRNVFLSILLNTKALASLHWKNDTHRQMSPGELQHHSRVYTEFFIVKKSPPSIYTFSNYPKKASDWRSKWNSVDGHWKCHILTPVKLSLSIVKLKIYVLYCHWTITTVTNIQKTLTSAPTIGSLWPN